MERLEQKLKALEVGSHRVDNLIPYVHDKAFSNLLPLIIRK